MLVHFVCRKVNTRSIRLAGQLISVNTSRLDPMRATPDLVIIAFCVRKKWIANLVRAQLDYSQQGRSRNVSNSPGLDHGLIKKLAAVQV
jgi:hypothetical protein